MPINQITSNNTFQQWLTATQSLIQFANTLTDGNGATFTSNTILKISGTGSKLIVDNSANINQLYANTINVVSISSNTSYSNVSNTSILNATSILAANANISNISASVINFSGQQLDKVTLDQYDGAVITAQAAFDKANNISLQIINDTVSSSIQYMLFIDTDTGAVSDVKVSNTQIYFYPDTGTLYSKKVQSSGFLDSSSRTLVVKDSNGNVVWGE
jgi:hypothetical protein